MFGLGLFIILYLVFLVENYL